MRYVLLVALNIPIILLAFINLITQYKLKKIDKTRFKRQITIWSAILALLIFSFPLYNASIGYPLLASDMLNLFDVFQTTAIIYILYFLNNQHRKIEQNEHLIRDLHQELSIKLSKQSNAKSSR